MIRDLIMRNRSYRRFEQSVAIEEALLRELVDLARLSGSAGNLQPLKYVLTCEPSVNEQVFTTLAWAGNLTDWPGPAPGERPSAYITILNDASIRKGGGCDHGIAAQSILLGAVERGLGGCMIGSIDNDKLREILHVPVHLEIILVIALGKPVERVELEEAEPGGSIKYYRDSDGVHHVPKRRLDEIII